MNKYDITKNTLALIGKTRTSVHVLEFDKDYIISNKISNIINDNCNYYGSSYLGRIEGTKNIIGLNSKLPIIVEESNNIIIFPLSSPRSENCIWINLLNLKEIKKSGKSTQIIFNNNSTILVDKSHYSVRNQLNKARLLNELLNVRKMELNQDKIPIS